MGFGTASFGVGAFGVGGESSTFQVASAAARTLNVVRVVFTQQPTTFDRTGITDALNPDNWRLEAREPSSAKVRLVQFVERATSNTLAVDLSFDGRLDSGARYRVIAAATLQAVDETPIDPVARFADFDALLQPRAFNVTVPRGIIDVANPQLVKDAPRPNALLGEYQPRAGALALDDGVSSLRKRVLRRLITGVGGFQHLPDYGLDLAVKGLVRPDVLRRLQVRARQQILQEPDVIAARVTVRTQENAPNVAVIRAQVETNVGATEEVVQAVNLGE